MRADRLAYGVEECAWVRCSAGDGAKGPRVYDWATVDIRPLREPGQGYWLLVRRSLANPRGTGLLRLLRTGGNKPGGTGEGRRKPVGHKECFEEAKGQVGLDQYEVRRWDGWYRHITLAMLAHAYLSVTSIRQWNREKRGLLRSGRTADPPDSAGGAPAAHPPGMDREPTGLCTINVFYSPFVVQVCSELPVAPLFRRSCPACCLS